MKFGEKTLERIDSILENACRNKRKTLYEFEVYQILEATGLDVPKFSYVENPEEITKETLSEFGPDIIVKIVSSSISHKQKLGGVKKIQKHEPLYVQYVLSQMRKEVLSHFDENEQPEIEGFLLVEYVPHTQAIGYEVLIGFKEDNAFGPIVTLSKGGDDAEFFAKYYDPANLFVPPLNYEDSLEMQKQLKIRHKFKQINRSEYLELMANAASVISRLAYHYSFVADPAPKYIFKSMDINPFVITEDNRFVVIDGFAEFIRAEENEIKPPEINLNNIEPFFNPNGIAVIGVSADNTRHSLGREIAQLLHDLNRDDLYFVNVKGGSITFDEKEYPFYRNIKEVPGQVDLAVYTAPAKFTLDFFNDLKDVNVKSVILISGIPSDVKYTEFAEKLDRHVPEDVRVIGPNCMGTFYAPGKNSKGLNTLFIEQKRLEIKYSDFSNTVLLTQSGALAVTEIDKLQNAKLFKSIVSFGNKYDVKITDLMAFFSTRNDIDVISLYIEGFDPGEGRQFFQLARKIEKPIIAYKSGRTEAGAKAAASHTASMTGNYDVFQASCHQAGVILAENIEDHYDYVKVFSLLAGKIPRGNKVAGVVNAGFESTVGADELKHLSQAEFSPETVEQIRQVDRYGLVDTSTTFLDITPMADDKMYAGFVEAALKDDNVDCVFVAIVPHTVTLKTIPDTCGDPDSLANLLVDLNRKYNKPIVISVNAGRYYQDFVSILEENGLPVYPDIRAAIKSLDRFVTFHTKK